MNPSPVLPISLNESPSEKEGKYALANAVVTQAVTLNESPSEKEGKCTGWRERRAAVLNPQ